MPTRASLLERNRRIMRNALLDPLLTVELYCEIKRLSRLIARLLKDGHGEDYEEDAKEALLGSDELLKRVEAE